MFGNSNTQSSNIFGQGAQQPVSNPFGRGDILNQNQPTNGNLPNLLQIIKVVAFSEQTILTLLLQMECLGEA
jgi:hypothetical protein